MPFRAVSSASVRTTRPQAAPASPARTASTYRPAPQAVNPEDSEEPPPPPYASEDPEPDATRDLQVRLAAEAQAAGNLNLPEASARNETEHENSEGQGNNNAQNGESGRPSQSTPTTVVHAPPPGPPPTHSPPAGPPPASSIQRQESRRSEHHPSTPPTDPEEARILEESQLEEVMRISRASERERLELEEAMRLSLAESEATPSNSNSNPNTNFNSNNNNNDDYGVFEGNEDHDSSGPSSRRISSYNPASQLEGNHRRAASDTYSHNPRPVEEATSGMDHLTIPDTWQAGGASSSHGNLMDDDFGSIDFKQPALAPQRTGAVLQSKNPFLSPGERETDQQQASSSFIQPSSGDQGEQSTSQNSPGISSQYSAPQGSPNEKRLPTIPGSHAASPTVYEPPPGPPPSDPISPPAQQRAYLPPLPPRQPTIPVEGSPNSHAQNSSTQSRRLPPRPQGNAPALPQRNVSASMYSATNLPTSSFPAHTPQPSSPSFFPPQPSPRSASSTAMNQAISTHHGGEDPLETLRDFHTVFMGTSYSCPTADR
jgi:hypothetical protein